MNSIETMSANELEQEKDLIKTIVRENCISMTAVKKPDTKIRYSKKVYRELFYRDNICIGTRLLDLKTGNVVNEAGEISFESDVYIFGVTCPANTTAVLKTEIGRGGFAFTFINDIFVQPTEDIPNGSNMLIKMEDNDYSELLFGVSANTYGERL